MAFSAGVGPGGMAGAQEPRREDKAGAGRGRDTGKEEEKKERVLGAKHRFKNGLHHTQLSDGRHGLSFPEWEGGLWPWTEIVL